MSAKNPINLTGVPETMLWTLYNRAGEARRPDGILRDPECVRVYESIDYDYARSFGKPDASHPMRSRVFDDALRPWLQAHPGGTVVELGAGLETQFHRCDDDRVQWLCVDVPEAIAVRERFLPPSERCRYVPKSALDLGWLDEVDPAHGVFVSAQGLFMYFEEEDVRRLFVAIIERCPGVELMFDTIPPWFSRKTLEGFQKTKNYRAPPMPWGIRRDDIEPLLRRWSPRVASTSAVNYGLFARGLSGALLRLCSRTPGLRNLPPAIVHVKTTGATAHA
ncbi:class I SAM-dependent methyltransferase [Archangium violaceum]|uniref:class I SAM-dependent methyltransferase n=1 Tax=Archangium violaceum TaxID=83451 RepID=UPI002B2870F5|nr:class I SAM-dependent methyltransferase [Archangium gephyra]